MSGYRTSGPIGPVNNLSVRCHQIALARPLGGYDDVDVAVGHAGILESIRHGLGSVGATATRKSSVNLYQLLVDTAKGGRVPALTSGPDRGRRGAEGE